jgi:excisionase family DNA binding protein
MISCIGLLLDPKMRSMNSHPTAEIGARRSGETDHARLLTAREVACRLGVSTETVLRWTRSGDLPGFRMPGGALRYDELALDDWLADRATSEADAAIRDEIAGDGRRLGLAHHSRRAGGDCDAVDPARSGI